MHARHRCYIGASMCGARAARSSRGDRRPAGVEGKRRSTISNAGTRSKPGGAGGDIDVAVIGAGPGGLAAALALQAAGLSVRVFEQREEYRPAGAGIFIWPHGLKALDAIDSDTANRVISAGAVIRSLAIEQLVPGAAVAEELLTIDLAGFAERSGSFPQIGITWARLTNALREGLEPGTVRLGHKLAGLVVEATSSGSGSGGVSNSAGGTGGVTLTFEAPRSGAVAPPPVFVRGCVVGADGRNSRVRELAFDDKVENTLSTSSSPSSSPAAHTPATFPAFTASDGQSAKAPSGDAGATVYYALSPNPPPGAGGTGSFNEMRFSLCNGSGITLLDVGRGNLDLDGGGDEAQVPGSNSSGGQLMFGTTRFTEAAPTFETPEARLGHLRSFFVDTTPLLQASIAATEPRAVVQTQLFERASAQRWSKAGR